MGAYIMAIDQGTTGSRAMLIDGDGQVVSSAYAEFPQIFPQPGWVEHDPEEIWKTTQQVMQQTVSSSDIPVTDIAGIGITNQRETTVLWDRKTLKPVYNAIVWQCRRSASICDRLKSEGLEDRIQAKSGLVVDAYFSGTKVKWLLDEVAGLREKAIAGDLAFGTIDTWLIARLTGGRVHATDYTNASRTMMFNIHEKKWDADLLDILGVPENLLPEVMASAEVVGHTDADQTGGTSIPIAGIAGDQQAALFGQGCFDAGQGKNTYGTGCFLLLNMADNQVTPDNGLILTLACDENGQPCYALEGSVFIGGAVIQWLRDGLGLIEHAAETQAIAESVDSTGGVYLVPALAGLGAPYWDMYARGGILGITRGTTRAHIVRAALEGIAFQVKDLTDAFETAAQMKFTELRVDGGACRNDFLMQFQADLIDCPVNRSNYIESTGVGAAFLAGVATGLWSAGEGIRNLRKTDKIFNPSVGEADRQRRCNGWKAAVERVKSGK
jgi:glycerol kinase